MSNQLTKKYGLLTAICTVVGTVIGSGVFFKAEKILSEEAVEISIELQDGNGTGKAWGCDLTYDYVKINGDYRT